MTGRRLDTIWQHFIKLKSDNKPIRAKCKYCEKEMCSLVARMKTHIRKCNFNKDKDLYNQSDQLEMDNNNERQNCKYSNIILNTIL